MRKETKVGLMAAIAIVLLIFGYGVISGDQVFSSKKYYYAHYDRINGLQASNPVTLKGHRIGEVEGIQLIQRHQGGNGLLVKFSIKKAIDIPQASEARIYSSSLLGSKAVKLLFDSNRQASYEPGDTLKGTNAASLTESLNQQLDPLKKKTKGFIQTMDTMVSTINSIMEEGGKEDLQASLKNFRNSLNNLTNTTKSLNNMVNKEGGNIEGIINNTQAITEDLKQNTGKIDNTLTNISNISDSLASADIKNTLSQADSMANRLNRIAGKIDKGEGSAGKFINNDSLYRNLESTSKELNQLVKDLQNNPGRYLNFSILNFQKNRQGEQESE